MINRVHIDALARVVDLEGEKEFVEGLLAKLFPLIEEFGRTRAVDDKVDDPEVEGSSKDPGETGVLAEETGKPKIKRRRGATPPKGQSCADRILVLKSDGFFKQHRTGPDIINGLKIKGWTHNRGQVAAAAGSLFDRGQLQRTKEGDSAFKYFWDRD